MNARTMAALLVLLSVFGFGPSVSPVPVSAQSPRAVFTDLSTRRS